MTKTDLDELERLARSIAHLATRRRMLALIVEVRAMRAKLRLRDEQVEGMGRAGTGLMREREELREQRRALARWLRTGPRDRAAGRRCG